MVKLQSFDPNTITSSLTKTKQKQMIKVIKNSKYLILFCLLMMSSLSYSQGSRYTGTYTKSAPIEYSNKNNIVIEGLEFSDANNRTLTLWSCDNIIIRKIGRAHV